MPEEMNLSVNGQSQVPPGFRFHPTEEELLHYYLRKKVASKKIDLDVIRDVDLNKLEPWDIQERCRIGSTPQNDWYFFSHKDKKYPTGTRTNRATAAGFWKATGRDKVIYSNSKRIGMRKTLVFYKGRAPHGQKSDWIMHEYRLDDNNAAAHDIIPTATSLTVDPSQEDGWVVCRVFKKKNYLKVGESSQNSSTTMDSRNRGSTSSGNEGILDRILVYMGRSCKQENGTITNILDNSEDSMQFLINNNPINSNPSLISEGIHTKFMHLPGLENSISPTNIPSSPFNQDQYSISMNDIMMLRETEPSSCTMNDQAAAADQDPKVGGGLSDWAALDRLVASQLNGQAAGADDGCRDDEVFSSCYPSTTRLNNQQDSQVYMTSSEVDFWGFARSSSSSTSDPLCHLSV